MYAEPSAWPASVPALMVYRDFSRAETKIERAVGASGVEGASMASMKVEMGSWKMSNFESVCVVPTTASRA